MIKSSILCFVAGLFLLMVDVYAQSAPAYDKTKKDSAIIIPMFSATYSLQIPGGDLADRFGVSSTIGASFATKLKSNWFFSLECVYLFGRDLKETSIFDSIIDSSGEIISITGDYAQINLSERGFHANFKAGKILPVSKALPNSGIMVSAGVGLLQHKIWIEVDGNNAPQIGEEYRKGYDRLTNGLALNEFVGYTFLGNRKHVNFYIGVEFIQAWTRCRRDYNFDTMEKDNEKRLDLLHSIKLGWIIPIYKRDTERYYEY